MRALWSLEYRVDRKWLFFDAYERLGEARHKRDWCLSGCDTRIRRWHRQ